MAFDLIKEAARDRIDAEKANHDQAMKKLGDIGTRVQNVESRVKGVEDKLKME